MATGTGKTFTPVNQIYRLMKAGVAKRLLFLVDRRALAAQTVRAFSAFEVEPGKKFESTATLTVTLPSCRSAAKTRDPSGGGRPSRARPSVPEARDVSLE
jgi:DNA-binding Lrp family transcriptional regulator